MFFSVMQFVLAEVIHCLHFSNSRVVSIQHWNASTLWNSVSLCPFLVKDPGLDASITLCFTPEFIPRFSHLDPLNLNLTSHLAPGMVYWKASARAWQGSDFICWYCSLPFIRQWHTAVVEVWVTFWGSPKWRLFQQRRISGPGVPGSLGNSFWNILKA